MESVALWTDAILEDWFLPLLPPPVVAALKQVDSILEPYVGSHGFVIVLSTLWTAWLLGWILYRFTYGGPGSAFIDETEKKLESQLLRDDASTTVLLTGSRKSGKTRLFSYLVHDQHQTVTVMSIQSNVAILNGIRYVDWPGCRTLEPTITDLIHNRHQPLRVVLMVDATQPARSAAESLWQLLPHLAQRRGTTATPVLVACHKQDVPKARNEKRLRIQLRNELERLRGKEEPSWWPAEASSYEDFKFWELSLEPTTLESVKGARDLAEWCRTGVFGATSTTTTTKKKKDPSS